MYTQLRLLGRFLVFSALFAALLAGCGGKGGRASKPSGHALFGAATPVTSPVLAWLPASTSVVLIADRIDRLARELGWDEVARLEPEAHARLVEIMDELFGHDVLDPARLHEIGLDATRPFGAAYLDPETLAVFLPLADPARFEETVQQLAPLWNQQVEVEVVGKARVLGPPYEDAWRMVVRERVALWIVALDDAHARAAAQTLATSSGPGLAGDPAFRRAMDELGYGADVAGYVAGALLGGELGVGDGGLAFGLDLGRDEIRARATVPARPGSVLERLLRAPETTPALLGTLSERPLALLDAIVDAEALFALSAVRQLDVGVEALAGVSLARDLAPLLAGEIGVAVVPAPGQDADGARPVIHALAELRDATRGEALLHRALASTVQAGQAEATGPSSYRIPRPGSVLYVGVAGNWLYASTGWSPETLPALAAGNAQAFEMALGPGTLATLLLGPHQAALRASVDARLLGDWLLPRQVDTSFVQSRLAELESGYQPSAAFVRKRAELEAATTELVRLENAAVARTSEQVGALIDAAGTFALRVDPDRGEAGTRMVVHAAEIAGPGGVPALLAEILAALHAPPATDPAESEALGQARERVWQLLEELAAIRRSETGEPAPGPGPGMLPDPPSEPTPRPGRQPPAPAP